MMGGVDPVGVFHVGADIDCSKYLHYSVGVEWIITVSACSMLVPMFISVELLVAVNDADGVKRPS